MTIRDAVEIFRGYKRRMYEDYRVASWHVWNMAQMTLKDPKAFHPDRIMPPYDELDLTTDERKKLNTEKAMRQARDYAAQFDKK